MIERTWRRRQNSLISTRMAPNIDMQATWRRRTRLMAHVRHSEHQMNDISEGALIAFLGFALIKIGTCLIRLYERSMRLDPRKIMSWTCLTHS